MKISLDVTYTEQVEYDVEFPCYLQEGNNYYCFFNPIDLKKSITLTDYTIAKGVNYSLDFRSLNSILQRESAVHITKEAFQDKLVELLNIINGAIDEMRKAHEQQQGS
jgi:hypothetical protein